MKGRIDKMSLDELKNLAGDPSGSAPASDNMLFNNLLVCEPEIENIQKTVNDQLKELQETMKENQQ